MQLQGAQVQRAKQALAIPPLTDIAAVVSYGSSISLNKFVPHTCCVHGLRPDAFRMETLCALLSLFLNPTAAPMNSSARTEAAMSTCLLQLQLPPALLLQGCWVAILSQAHKRSCRCHVHSMALQQPYQHVHTPSSLSFHGCKPTMHASCRQEPHFDTLWQCNSSPVPLAFSISLSHSMHSWCGCTSSEAGLLL